MEELIQRNLDIFDRYYSLSIELSNIIINLIKDKNEVNNNCTLVFDKNFSTVDIHLGNNDIGILSTIVSINDNKLYLDMLIPKKYKKLSKDSLREVLVRHLTYVLIQKCVLSTKLNNMKFISGDKQYYESLLDVIWDKDNSIVRDIATILYSVRFEEIYSLIDIAKIESNVHNVSNNEITNKIKEIKSVILVSNILYEKMQKIENKLTKSLDSEILKILVCYGIDASNEWLKEQIQISKSILSQVLDIMIWNSILIQRGIDREYIFPKKHKSKLLEILPKSKLQLIEERKCNRKLIEKFATELTDKVVRLIFNKIKNTSWFSDNLIRHTILTFERRYSNDTEITINEYDEEQRLVELKISIPDNYDNIQLDDFKSILKNKLITNIEALPIYKYHIRNDKIDN